MNIRYSFLAMVLLPAMSFGVDAPAEPPQPSDPAQVVVFADLNLNSQSGLAILYKRIQRAASEVCKFPPPRRELRFVSERKACTERALDRAVQQVGVPALAALHLAKTGRESVPAQVATNQ